METTIIDHELLGSYADKLIAAKYQGASPADRVAERENLIVELDSYILDTIFESLSASRLDELNSMIENETITSADDLTEFYRASGLDLAKLIEAAAAKYTSAYLGGANND